MISWVLACGSPEATDPTDPTQPWHEPAPPLLADDDPDPARFAATITAAPARWELAPGVFVDGHAYNGVVPGPLVRVPVGTQVAITFANAAGWEDTIHWHGIEANNAADGTGVTQAHVHDGGSFLYEFVPPRPGLYWYHPHARAAQGVFNGLYAPLIVDDPDEQRLRDLGILPSEERVLVLSDVSVTASTPWSLEVDNAMTTMNGIEGNHLLVNGREDPTFDVPAGGAVRLRVVNSSATRFWRLSVPGRTLYRIGGQGGLLDRVVVEGGSITGKRLSLIDGTELGTTEVPTGFPKGEIVLAPAERADLVLTTEGDVGDVLKLRWEDVARGRHDHWMEGDTMVMGDAADDGTRPGDDVATFTLVKGPATPWTLTEGSDVLAAIGRSVGRVDVTGAVVREGTSAMVFSETMEMVQATDGQWVMTGELFLDGVTWRPDAHTGPDAPAAPTSFDVPLGSTLAWEIRNESDMSHPSHIHGFSYQVTRWRLEDEEAGEAVEWDAPYDEFVDTTLLPGNSSAFVAMPIVDPIGTGGALGRWMRHCHILQHGEAGMASEFRVVP